MAAARLKNFRTPGRTDNREPKHKSTLNSNTSGKWNHVKYNSIAIRNRTKWFQKYDRLRFELRNIAAVSRYVPLRSKLR